MSEHELKVWPSYFEALKDGRKTFEVRRSDRDFKVGDVLVLEEYDPDPQLQYTDPDSHGYTGRKIRATVTYLMRLGEFFRKRAIVVLGIKVDSFEEPEQ